MVSLIGTDIFNNTWKKYSVVSRLSLVLRGLTDDFILNLRASMPLGPVSESPVIAILIVIIETLSLLFPRKKVTGQFVLVSCL